MAISQAELRAGVDNPSRLPFRRAATPSEGWTGLVARWLFGVIWAIDAYLKWLPGYRDHFMGNLTTAAKGQPSWLHGWFHFWINLQSGSPLLWATLTGIAETTLALVLLLGIARRAGYIVGAAYSFLVWAVAEGFGGPYAAGTTDVGAGIIYTMMFITLLTFAPPARRERFSLDRILVKRFGWWRFLAEPHRVDRTHGAPLVEPVVVASNPSDGAERDRLAADTRESWPRRPPADPVRPISRSARARSGPWQHPDHCSA